MTITAVTVQKKVYNKILVVAMVSFLVSIAGILTKIEALEWVSILTYVLLFFAWRHHSISTPGIFYGVYFLSVVADIFLLLGYREYQTVILSLYAIAVTGMIIFAIVEFRAYRPTTIDIISIGIVVGFVLWISYYLNEIALEFDIARSIMYYVYNLLLGAFAFISYIHYTGKPNKASLFLTLSSAQAIISGSLYFLYEYTIQEPVMKASYAVFHFFWFFFLLNYIAYRRKSNAIKVLGL